MPKSVVRINTVPSYEVHIGSGLIGDCGTIIRERLGDVKLAVITDSNVAELYLEKAAASLEKAGYRDVKSFVFEAGELSKNINTLSNILEFLAENQLTRKDCVIALGGGVTGDMTGFAAACYLRGISYVQMPTTLLAAVDSSVGGKTAIDLAAGKNLAGAFIQPKLVICDTDCLDTLPDEVFSDGAAEAIKTGVLASEALLAAFEESEPGQNIQDIITRCVEYKGGVVERDEKEQGERKLLNLGHTIGHAIEKLSGYTITHGHAVAAGLAIISRAAAKRGLCDIALAKRIEAVLMKYSLPISCVYDAKALAEAALRDKKRAGDQITIIYPEKVGECRLKNIHVDELYGLIRDGLEG